MVLNGVTWTLLKAIHVLNVQHSEMKVCKSLGVQAVLCLLLHKFSLWLLKTLHLHHIRLRFL